MLTTQTNVIIFFLTIEISNCMEPFIIGGNFTKIFRFPHSAFLMVYADMGSSIWICGSSILNQRILLTAAHCLFPYDVEAQVDVLAGDENLLMVPILRRVIRFITHEDYNKPDNIDNDIALAMIDEDLHFDKSIKRVLIRNNFPSGSPDAQVSGWGLVDENELSSHLKYLKQTIQPREICETIGALHRGTFCAGNVEDLSQRATLGDAGNALIVSSYIQIGVMSFSTKSKPGIVAYTNITYYLPWIKHMSRILYCCCELGNKEQCLNVFYPHDYTKFIV